MRKLREARLIIRTGEHGTDHDVLVKVNGVRLVARKLAGGTDSGEIMPPKTTWFEPKLRSGLVVHSLK